MRKRRILVVDDEHIIARDIAMQLRVLGYEPLGPANTGEEAIEMAEQLKPDLMLMDVRLASAMDGITAAQTIRTRFGVPTVYLSAFSDAGSLDRAKQTDPAGFLLKPFMEFELAAAIKAAFQGR